MKYDLLLQEIGNFGLYQKKLCVIIFLAGIPNAFFIVSFAFTQFKTDFRCRFPDNNTINGGSVGNSSTIADSNWINGQCELYRQLNNDSSSNQTLSIEKTFCSSGWEYEDNNTAIAEFNLVCDDAWKEAFVVTMYMAGMTVGSLTGKLADRFGRRPMFLAFSYLQFAAAGFTGCSWNFESYAFGTFIMGTCGFMGYNIAVALSTEMAGSRRRGGMIALNLVSYVFGFMLTPLISFLLPNWRWYLRFCGLVGVPYVPFLYWFFPESVRWQIIRGKTKEAKMGIRAMAETNGRAVDIEELYKLVQISPKSDENAEMDEKKAKDDSLIQVYFRSSTMRNRLLTMNFYWVLAVLLYFAISLHPIKPDSGRHIHVLLVGMAEIPGYTFGYLTSKYFGERWCLTISAAAAGMTCLAIPFLLSSSTAVLGTITFLGKCFASSAYAYTAISVTKIAPTLIRYTAVGFSSAVGKIGGMIMPYLMHAGSTNSQDVPYFVMGGFAFVAAFFVILFIPDTGGEMPDTVAEAESNQSYYIAVSRRKLNSCFHSDKMQFGSEEKCAETLMLQYKAEVGNHEEESDMVRTTS